MVELLAVPAWGTPPRTLADWVDGLAVLGHRPTLEREPPDGAWLEVAPLRLRGFAVLEGDRVEAIHFELHAPDAVPASEFLESAAGALGWEIHADEEGDD